MTNEIRNLTDLQIKDIFKQTPRTANLEIHDIEYYHYELFPDAYLVHMTNGTKYTFQQVPRYNRGFGNRNYQVYNRIKKM